VLLSILGEDEAGAHLADGRRDDVDVALRQRAEVVVTHEDALAAEPVARGELGAEHGVADAPLQMEEREPLERAGDPDVEEHAREELASRVDRGTDEPLERRVLAEELALPLRDLPVATRDYPGRRALEEREPLHLRLDRRDDLDRRRARADDGDLPHREGRCRDPSAPSGRRCRGRTRARAASASTAR
jgi:hypothetical protein